MNFIDDFREKILNKIKVHAFKAHTTFILDSDDATITCRVTTRRAVAYIVTYGEGGQCTKILDIEVSGLPSARAVCVAAKHLADLAIVQKYFN